MNKIKRVIKSKKFKVVLIIVLLLLLLLFLLKGCQREIEVKKEQAINDNCVIKKNNLEVINELLNRTDLCSIKWFHDLDDFIIRLKDQNTYLESKDKDLYLKQEDIIEQLELFKKDQSSEKVTELKKSVEDYLNNYLLTCKEKE